LTVTDNQGATASDTVVVTVNPAVNQPPTANAGTDQSITLPSSSVTLSGSGSDADGSISSYAWTKVSGPATGSIASPSSASTGVSSLTIAGSYAFRLTVTDNQGATASDTVVVTVNPAVNQPPTANAGADQSITLPTSSVTLSGSGNDADGSISSYAWTKLSGPATGSIASPSSASTGVSSLTIAGSYSFRLTVTDNQGATASDTVVVTVNPAVNQPPTANAGTDQSITLPISSVTLSGSGSDADGTISTYAWTQLSGPVTGTIASPSSASTGVSGLSTAGTYIYRLSVTDNNGATAADTVNVTVNPAPSSTLTLVSWNAVWKYLDNGSDQNTAWRASSFSDTSWASGPAVLGYGDPDVATVISYGSNSSAKYITSYFRKQINFSNPSAYAGVTLNMRRDDGAIVYVNGTEVYRTNMPAGTVTYTTAASSAAADDGAGIFTANIPIAAFVTGTNTVAVEVHQNAGTSSDVVFDMEMIARDSSSLALLTRGPYLQMVSGTGATIRWRTDIATNSKVEVGTVHGTYTLSASDAASTTEHEVRITGLTPDTKYFYRFGSATSSLQSATTNYFITAPPANVDRKVRVAVFGDCGRNDNSYQTMTLSAYQNYVGANPGELMLLLGDNAYNSGTDAEYQSSFFNVYSSNILKNHALFPAPGNHDYANTSARQTDKNVPYYSNFTLPKSAECGGVASGTECFYSYDWGNIHFLSLDSYGFDDANNLGLRLYDTTSTQVQWIKNDLAANTRKWTVAYWHHPPYTMGSHNSDTETDLVKMRENFIRILERNGVDLILCGHSHDYERSYLLKGYYQNEAAFSVGTHAVTSSSGKYDGSANSCAYQTPSGKVNHGTVYVVSGSAGASGGVQANYPHNALPFAINDGGMFYFEVDDNRLDAKFIRKDGVIYDNFTIMKDVAQTQTLSTSPGQSVTLTASWKGTYSWSTGATTRSITVNPLVTTSYTCRDAEGAANCISDQYTVNVNAPVVTGRGSEVEGDLNAGKNGFSVYPVPVRSGTQLHVNATSARPLELVIYNQTGQVMRKLSVRGTASIPTTGWLPGVYFLRSADPKVKGERKFIISE
jgi:hypothetical protein